MKNGEKNIVGNAGIIPLSDASQYLRFILLLPHRVVSP